jgi:Ca2+-binding RTX toxin-like protein
MEDFEAGPGGDLLEVDTLLGKSIGPDGNPFTLGYLKLVASGEDTLIRWDRDGSAGTKFTLKTQLRLLGLSPGEITSDNFVGQLVIGTEGRDDLIGGIGNDTVQGLGGNDTLNGSLGADTLEGGIGNDLYFVDNAGDQVIEEDNVGALVLGGGRAGLAAGSITDSVRAAVDYALTNYVENLTLTGAALNGTGNELANVIKGNTRNNTLLGGDGNDRLDGSSGKDTLDGGGDDDRLTGGTGDDTLVWSSGNDTFDGGGGTDALRITAGNVDLPGGARIVNVEIVDLSGGESSTLTVTKSDVLAMSPTDILKVVGDSGDVVDVSGLVRNGSLNGFMRYTGGGATLLIEPELTVI